MKCVLNASGQYSGQVEQKPRNYARLRVGYMYGLGAHNPKRYRCPGSVEGPKTWQNGTPRDETEARERPGHLELSNLCAPGPSRYRASSRAK